MFEELPDPATCGELTPMELVSAIREYHIAVATSTARVWAFTAKLVAAREAEAADEEKLWVYDPWSGARDEVAAAMGLSPRRASGQLRIAEALTLRLPKVAELLERGMIDPRVAASIVYRTELVTPTAQPVIDAEIANRAALYTTYSDNDVELAVDAIIEEHDPDAVRRYRDATKSLDVQFGKPDDVTGTASVFGRILATDAELAARVLDAMAATVCQHDPRTKGELRHAGFGAVFRGHDRLVCQCGNPDCLAASIPSKVTSIVVHILAEAGTLDAALAEVAAAQHFHHNSDPDAPTVDLEAIARDADAATPDNGNGNGDSHDTPPPPETGYHVYLTPPVDNSDDGDNDGEDPPWAAPGPGTPPPPPPDHPDNGTAATPDTAESDGDASDPATPETPDARHLGTADSPAALTCPPAVSTGGHIIPTLLLAELIRTGATIELLPPPAAEPEPHYQFSDQLRRFIKLRDLRCSFPGCTRTAEKLDIDHTIAHADHGHTHPSNGKLLCRATSTGPPPPATPTSPNPAAASCFRTGTSPPAPCRSSTPTHDAAPPHPPHPCPPANAPANRIAHNASPPNANTTHYSAPSTTAHRSGRRSDDRVRPSRGPAPGTAASRTR
ncbi:HNH endonuclease signature motif containing protein [Mycolicibacterium tokaiense]|uniref:HNH endonuclease signature motif containing protein n=1 Tax=Mycolicibacterium tokaiense TaxID=39695 RepID=UPI0021F28868|nr:HNH endonuclease signature motif containing protein [Mycolicibacterium tokaiense]